MASSPSEHEIQQRIRLACGRGAVRLWRNNTGAPPQRLTMGTVQKSQTTSDHLSPPSHGPPACETFGEMFRLTAWHGQTGAGKGWKP
jgi:hypothetical protein